MIDPTPRGSSTSGRSAEAGFSIVEGLVAAALLLIIAVSILPMFTRALQNNLAGGRASQLSTFATADIESANQGTINRDEWDLLGTTDGVVSLDRQYWDTGPQFNDGAPDHVGDEQWRADRDDSQGLVLFWRDTSIRKFSLADLQVLASVDGSTGGVSVVGHPMLLDTPLTSDTNAHLVEVRVTIKENRQQTPARSGLRITVGHMRAY